MNLAFVGPALRAFAKLAGRLAGKADGNPRASAALTLLAGAAGWLGLRPEDLAAIGSALVAVGEVLQRLGGAG